MDEEVLKDTQHNKIFIGSPIDIDDKKMEQHLQMLKIAVEKEDTELIETIMKNLVPTFKRGEYKEHEVAATI